MATLTQIQSITNGGSALEQQFNAGRLQVAFGVVAETSGANLANRLAWSKDVFGNPGRRQQREFRWFLSAPAVQGTEGASVGSVTDAAVLTAIRSFVDAWANEVAAGL